MAATDSDGQSAVGVYVPLLVSSGGVETILGTLGMTWPAPHTTSGEARMVIESLASLAALTTDRARHASSAAERSEWFERMER